jgi:hypothetical protein
MVDGEEDDVQVETDDEDREPGSEGEGTEGQDAAGRDEGSDLSAQRTGDEDDEGEPPARAPAQHETQQRGTRFQRLANENREYKERLERLERDRENERLQWQRQQQQINEAQERDRLALMTPEERADYRISQQRNEMRQEMQQLRLQTAMQTDKASFDAKVTVNPVYRRMQAAVEEMFQEQVRKGQPTDRETILYHLLGKQAANGASNLKPRRDARRRVENERVRPSSGKGDTARRSSEGRASTVEQRLKDVLI